MTATAGSHQAPDTPVGVPDEAAPDGALDAVLSGDCVEVAEVLAVAPWVYVEDRHDHSVRCYWNVEHCRWECTSCD
jgi:hypothetical protein